MWLALFHPGRLRIVHLHVMVGMAAALCASLLRSRYLGDALLHPSADSHSTPRRTRAEVHGRLFIPDDVTADLNGLLPAHVADPYLAAGGTVHAVCAWYIFYCTRRPGHLLASLRRRYHGLVLFRQCTLSQVLWSSCIEVAEFALHISAIALFSSCWWCTSLRLLLH